MAHAAKFVSVMLSASDIGQRQALALAILAEVADAGRQPRAQHARSERPHRRRSCPGRDRHLAACHRVEAEDGAHHLRAAGAHQSGDAEHLAAAQVEARRAHRRQAPGGPSPTSTAAPASCRVRGGKRFSTDRPTMCAMSCSLVDAAIRAAGHAAAVAQHGEDIGDLADLLEEVADVDDAEPLRAQPRDQREQPIDVGALQAARRLVHQQDAAVGRERAADLDDLLCRERQLPDDAVRPQLGVREVGEQVASCARRRRPGPRCRTAPARGPAGCSRRPSGAGRATAPDGSGRCRGGSRRAARPGRYG